MRPCRYLYTMAGLAVYMLCVFYGDTTVSTNVSTIVPELPDITSEESEEPASNQNQTRKIHSRLPSAALFKNGRAELTPEGKTLLADLVQEMGNARITKMRVECHTDDLPTSTPQYPGNWYFSAARAISVGMFFSEELKMDPAAIHTVGRGRYAPLASNDTEEGRSINNRIDIIFMITEES